MVYSGCALKHMPILCWSLCFRSYGSANNWFKHESGASKHAFCLYQFTLIKFGTSHLSKAQLHTFVHMSLLPVDNEPDVTG